MAPRPWPRWPVSPPNATTNFVSSFYRQCHNKLYQQFLPPSATTSGSLQQLNLPHFSTLCAPSNILSEWQQSPSTDQMSTGCPVGMATARPVDCNMYHAMEDRTIHTDPSHCRCCCWSHARGDTGTGACGCSSDSVFSPFWRLVRARSLGEWRVEPRPADGEEQWWIAVPGTGTGTDTDTGTNTATAATTDTTTDSSLHSLSVQVWIGLPFSRQFDSTQLRLVFSPNEHPLGFLMQVTSSQKCFVLSHRGTSAMALSLNSWEGTLGSLAQFMGGEGLFYHSIHGTETLGSLTQIVAIGKDSGWLCRRASLWEQIRIEPERN
jgi:hypothetical protein